MNAFTQVKIIRREIEHSDLEEVALCLKRNFPRRSLNFWKRLLARLAEAPVRALGPRFGYLIEADGGVVAVMLTIAHQSELAGAPPPRCNLSSWCADPAHRHLAAMLPMKAFARSKIAFTDLTAAPHTLPAIEALGFKSFAGGSVVAPAWSQPKAGAARVVAFSPEAPEAQALPAWERQMLADHARLGLTALVGAGAGEPAAFVLKPLPLWRHPIPAMLVLYARSHNEISRYARALAKHCLMRGRGSLVVGANGPISGLNGRYVEGLYARYYRGAEPSAPTDLAYSELALM